MGGGYPGMQRWEADVVRWSHRAVREDTEAPMTNGVRQDKPVCKWTAGSIPPPLFCSFGDDTTPSSCTHGRTQRPMARHMFLSQLQIDGCSRCTPLPPPPFLLARPVGEERGGGGGGNLRG